MDPQNQNPNPLENNPPVNPPINPAPSFTPPQPTASSTPNTFVPPPQYSAPAVPASGGGLSLAVVAVLVTAIAVVGGGYYWMSSSGGASPQGENNQLAPAAETQSNNSQPVPGQNYCGNWPSVDPRGMAQALVASGSSVPAAFYSGLPVPPQSKYLGASKRDPQPIVLTVADADKGAKGVGMFFFCSDMGTQQVFDYMKANAGVWNVKNPISAAGIYGLTLQQVVTGAQDYFADVLILDAGGKTLITFALTTFF